jgi:hypothetical protein
MAPSRCAAVKSKAGNSPKTEAAHHEMEEIRHAGTSAAAHTRVLLAFSRTKSSSRRFSI